MSGFNTNTLVGEVECMCQLSQIPLSQTCGLSDIFYWNACVSSVRYHYHKPVDWVIYFIGMHVSAQSDTTITNLWTEWYILLECMCQLSQIPLSQTCGLSDIFYWNACVSSVRYHYHKPVDWVIYFINPLNPELNPICYLLALLGAHHFLHVSRIRVKLLTFRLLMSYIYGAPILDVSRSHTMTQHSR